MFPILFGFFLGIAPEGVAVMTDIGQYLDFIIAIFFAFGLAFEVPVATFLLIAAGATTPDKLAEKVEAGRRVRVPLGKGNRLVTGYCVKLGVKPCGTRPLKTVAGVMDARPLLSPAMLRLAEWIADHYLCNLGQVLETAVPAGVRAQALEPSGKLVDDFRIVESDRMIHVLNAPSPAATASISIGNKIAQMVKENFTT